MFKGNRRSAGARGPELNRDFDAVGDLDKRNAAIHSVLFPIKGHRPVDGPGTGTTALNLESELFCFGNSANREVAVHIEYVRPRLNNFRRMEGDVLILLYMKKVFAFQLVVLHTAPSINTVGLDLDVQNASGHICGAER